MLARYRMHRGQRPPDDPLPAGLRKDTRKHCHHCLSPTAEIVTSFLAAPSDEEWQRFRKAYLSLLETRFEMDPTPFEELADMAQANDVFIGCSCPTVRNPNVNHCHTVLALEFMKDKFPDLVVRFP